MYSRKWLIVALVVCGLASACSDYNTNLSIQTSSSVLTFVSPSSATVGAQGFTITATGSGFVTGALILWNGTALTTTLVSANQLNAPVPASDLAAPGTVQVSVQIPGSAQSATQNINNTTTTEISNIVLFTIGAAPGTPPALTSLSASTTSAASTPSCSAQGFTLTVNGTNFTSDSMVTWNGAQQTTTFVSATQLTAAIPATVAAFAGTVNVTVTNSLGSSGSLPFTVTTPTTALLTPTIATLSQTSAPAGNAALTVNVTGTNFLPCSTVQWSGVNSVKSQLPTTFVSATQLTATIPAGDFTPMGTANVAVVTPGASSASSNIAFMILAPTVTSLSASTTSGASTPSCSASAVSLTVTGTNFANSSIVEWAASPPPAVALPLATTFVSSTQLTAVIPISDIVAPGSVNIEVSSAGALSNTQAFSISAGSPAAPTITAISPTTATAGTPDVILTISGTNLLPCSGVQWTIGSTTTQLSTTYVPATQSLPVQLTATLPAADIAAVQTAQVAVASPAAGTTVSNAVSFPVVLPTITSLSASSTSANNTVACGPSGITLTVNGTNFVPNGLVVNWNGSPRATSFVSATQLTAAISVEDVAFPGPINVTVSSSTFPALASASSPFTISPVTTALPVPAITRLLPASAQVGSAAFILGVDASSSTSGGSLVPCSVVQWNGSPRTTTFASPAGVNAAILSTDLAAAAIVPVTVTTPTTGGGGGTSNALTFTVFPQPPMPVARVTALAQTAGNAAVPANPIALPAPTMSADQRYTVAVLASTDGVSEASGAPENIFVHDTCAGAPSGCAPSVNLASTGINGSAADGSSSAPSISADGRYVTFLSSARNLVDSDTNGVTDVFVRDTCAGVPSGCAPTTQRVSLATDGTQANGASISATISPTGRYITFQSAATNLAAASSSGLFLRDTCAGAEAPCTPSTQALEIK